MLTDQQLKQIEDSTVISFRKHTDTINFPNGAEIVINYIVNGERTNFLITVPTPIDEKI